jgi:hypothetical protein
MYIVHDMIDSNYIVCKLIASSVTVNDRMEEGAAGSPLLRGHSRSQASDNQNKGVETSCQTWIAVHS